MEAVIVVGELAAHLLQRAARDGEYDLVEPVLICAVLEGDRSNALLRVAVLEVQALPPALSGAEVGHAGPGAAGVGLVAAVLQVDLRLDLDPAHQPLVAVDHEVRHAMEEAELHAPVAQDTVEGAEDRVAHAAVEAIHERALVAAG